MNKWVIGIIIGVLKDPDVQKFLRDTAKTLLGDVMTEKILGFLPAMFAAMLDTTIKQIPGIENITDIKAVADTGLDVLNHVIPDLDTGFKPLDDLLDMWRPKG